MKGRGFMDIRSLETFIQVAELSSFTRAGEKLGYSQPTISFQIRSLENELNVKLFERIGHTVRLTDAGENALVYAQNICRLCGEMVSGENNRENVSGVIRLAMADSLCSSLVASRFLDFRKSYPNISVHVTTAGTDAMFRLLDHNEVDVVCTLDSHIYDANYVIANEEKVGVHFVASANSEIAKVKKLTLERLIKEPFLLTEKGMSYRYLMDQQLAKNSIEIHPILEIGSTAMLCNLIEKGGGVSFLPDYVSEDAVKRGTVVRLDVKDFEIEIWKQLLYHRGKWISPQMKAVIEHLSAAKL